MKKLQLAQLCVCIFVCSFLLGSQMKMQPEELILQTFYTVGAEPELYVLHHGGRISALVSKTQLDVFVQKMQHSLKLSSISKQEDIQGIHYTLKGNFGRNLFIELNVINDEPSKKAVQPYISIQISGRGKPNGELAKARNRLTQVLQANKIIPHFHFSIQGSIPMKSSRLDHPIVQAFEKLHAKEVESMRTSHTVSLSAYSPLIEESLKTEGGLMNIQAATRVNHEKQRLMFTLGTPIITIEY